MGHVQSGKTANYCGLVCKAADAATRSSSCCRVDWFTHIAAASEELQREFEYMVSVGATPREYGLKVRSHPALLVTSAVKMRHGTEMSSPTQASGVRPFFSTVILSL